MPIFTAEERVGQTIAGKYRLDRILGDGGMGVVYDARHEALGRAVAVKFLHVALTRDDEVVRRFLNEARAASSLAHPNVVDVLDVGTAEDAAPFIVMERLDGESLAARIAREGRLSVEDAWTVLRPAMEAIAFAHARDIVHRDLKPDNVFLHRNAKGEQVTKVLDFGIAKLGSDATGRGTATGALLGTALYMAPEQSRGRGVGTWSDVWAMGIVWYEALSGRFPFDIDHESPTTEVLVRLAVDAPTPIATHVPSLPARVAEVIDRALSKEPAARPRTMAEMLRDMDAAFASPARRGEATRSTAEPGPRPVERGSRVPRAIGAVVLLVAIVGAGVMAMRDEPEALAPPPRVIAETSPPQLALAAPAVTEIAAPPPPPLAAGLDPPASTAPPPARPSGSRRASVAPAPVEPPPPPASEASVAPVAASAAQPTSEEVLAAMGRVTSTLHACGEYQHGVARVRVFVAGATGRVTRAVVTGALSGTVAGACVARSLRAVSFQPFRNAEFVFVYPIQI